MLKRMLAVVILSLVLVGCGSKNTQTTCSIESEAGSNMLNFTYVFDSKDGNILKEKRTIVMTYGDEETAKAAISEADIGEESGDGYSSVIKQLDATSISSTLTIDYTKVSETSAEVLGLDAVDGVYTQGNLEESTTFLLMMFPDMQCTTN